MAKLTESVLRNIIKQELIKSLNEMEDPTYGITMGAGRPTAHIQVEAGSEEEAEKTASDILGFGWQISTGQDGGPSVFPVKGKKNLYQVNFESTTGKYSSAGRGFGGQDWNELETGKLERGISGMKKGAAGGMELGRGIGPYMRKER